MTVYTDAYKMLLNLDTKICLSETDFYQQVRNFRDSFIASKDYYNRISKHRNPIVVMNEVLQETYDYLNKLSQREEMRDVEIKGDKTICGYVTTRVIDIWQADKNVKSLYRAVEIYCDLTRKDLTSIAIHIAERRGIEKILPIIRKDIRKTEQNAQDQSKQFRHFGDINVINVEPFIKSFLDYQCGKTHIAEISGKDFEIKHFTTQPLEGFAFQPDFPLCCENHKNLLSIGEQKFAEFPNCCELHKNLLKAKWFSKENYAYMPMKFVTALTYTWHCIAKCIKNNNWFKEITDYIELTKNSFGQFPYGYGAPVGLDLYLYNLQKNLEAEKDIEQTKKEKLIAFIQNHYNRSDEIEQTDINLLISKYKEWLKIFPFDIPFFNGLKENFENRIPILNGKGDTNIYSGMTGFKLKTKKELIGLLTSTTLKIIQEVNSAQLYKNNMLPNPFELQKQVIVSKRQIEIEELDKTDWQNRKEYIKLLKKWLIGEKKFLSEMAPLLLKEDFMSGFIHNIIDGMRELQNADTNAACIMNVRNDLTDKETSFRYWFKTFMAGRYPNAVLSAEEEKGDGRIDLKITQKPYGCQVVEFKGWWNYDKKNSPQQVCSYLTDFEKQGYVFMINHLKQSAINDRYKDLVTSPNMKYVAESWKEHKIENADVSYFESRHKFSIKEKTVYHFIFNVNF